MNRGTTISIKTIEHTKPLTLINAVKKVIQVIVSLLSFLLLLLVIISSLDHFNYWDNSSIFFGASYISPLWLTCFAVILVLGFLLLRKRGAAISASLIALVYFISFGDYSFSFLGKENQKTNESISILSLNVRYYSSGIDKVFKFIKSVDADLVLLSENVLEDNDLKIIDSLNENYYLVSGKKYETAILTKYPVLSSREVELPTYQTSLSGSNQIAALRNNPRRSFTHITVEYKDQIVNVISLRLIAGRPLNKTIKEQLKWGNYLANKHVEEVDFFIDYIKNLKGPVIFGGDLNIPPNAKIMKQLYGIAEDAAYTNNFIPLPTFRTEFPLMRLDYIFTSNGIKAVNYYRINQNVSDHYPVYAEVDLDKSSTKFNYSSK